MQKMLRRVQQLERRGSADAGDAGADEPQPDLEFGAKRTRQAYGIDGKFSGIDGKIVPSKQVSASLNTTKLGLSIFGSARVDRQLDWDCPSRLGIDTLNIRHVLQPKAARSIDLVAAFIANGLR
jgi:hypothetical protein